MATGKPLTIHCGTHRDRISTVICGHMLGSSEKIVGFIENRSDPTDLQAWCDDCERLFLAEGGMTEEFRAFNQISLVCDLCYAMIKARNWPFQRDK